MQHTVNGLRVAYTLRGPADAPVVMFSHSLATDHRMWSPQHGFAERYRLLHYDARGHGGSPPGPGDCTLEDLAADAHGLLDALGIERVHWVGISMGGMIGQAFALAYPERLHSLALCDTLCEFPPAAAAAWRKRIATALDQGMEALVEDTIERWFSPAFVAAAASQVAPVRAMIRATAVGGYVACSRAIMQLDYRQRLAAIGCPALVVVGEDDPGTPVAASRVIHEHLPGSTLQVVPSARHLCNIEQAGAFNRILAEFLTGVRA